MDKPREHRFQPKDVCACGREKKVMAKYCIKCGAEINTLRGKIGSLVNKERKEEAKQKLSELLAFHGVTPVIIKTKTTKVREKRQKQKEL